MLHSSTTTLLPMLLMFIKAAAHFLHQHHQGHAYTFSTFNSCPRLTAQLNYKEGLLSVVVGCGLKVG